MMTSVSQEMEMTLAKRTTAPKPRRCFLTPATIVLVVMMILVSMVWHADAYNVARGCSFNSQRRVENVENCRYGWEVDACGNKVCTKGPGQVCGGKHKRYGICGEGLMCNNCQRCQGCSLKTLECFDDLNCFRYN